MTFLADLGFAAAFADQSGLEHFAVDLAGSDGSAAHFPVAVAD